MFANINYQIINIGCYFERIEKIIIKTKEKYIERKRAKQNVFICWGKKEDKKSKLIKHKSDWQEMCTFSYIFV